MNGSKRNQEEQMKRLASIVMAGLVCLAPGTLLAQGARPASHATVRRAPWLPTHVQQIDCGDGRRCDQYRLGRSTPILYLWFMANQSAERNLGRPILTNRQWRYWRFRDIEHPLEARVRDGRQLPALVREDAARDFVSIELLLELNNGVSNGSVGTPFMVPALNRNDLRRYPLRFGRARYNGRWSSDVVTLGNVEERLPAGMRWLHYVSTMDRQLALVPTTGGITVGQRIDERLRERTAVLDPPQNGIVPPTQIVGDIREYRGWLGRRNAFIERSRADAFLGYLERATGALPTAGGDPAQLRSLTGERDQARARVSQLEGRLARVPAPARPIVRIVTVQRYHAQTLLVFLAIACLVGAFAAFMRSLRDWWQAWRQKSLREQIRSQQGVADELANDLQVARNAEADMRQARDDQRANLALAEQRVGHLTKELETARKAAGNGKTAAMPDADTLDKAKRFDALCPAWVGLQRTHGFKALTADELMKLVFRWEEEKKSREAADATALELRQSLEKAEQGIRDRDTAIAGMNDAVEESLRIERGLRDVFGRLTHALGTTPEILPPRNRQERRARQTAEFGVDYAAPYLELRQGLKTSVETLRILCPAVVGLPAPPAAPSVPEQPRADGNGKGEVPAFGTPRGASDRPRKAITETWKPEALPQAETNGDEATGPGISLEALAALDHARDSLSGSGTGGNGNGSRQRHPTTLQPFSATGVTESDGPSAAAPGQDSLLDHPPEGDTVRREPKPEDIVATATNVGPEAPQAIEPVPEPKAT